MQEGVFLDVGLLSGAHRNGPLVLPWPAPGNPGGFLSISTAAEWRDFILSLSLSPGIPEIVAAKFRRAQMLYFLAWLYFDLIKTGELVALVSLELALKDRYGFEAEIKAEKKRKKKRTKKGKNMLLDKAKGSNINVSFADLLTGLLGDGLTDDKVPMVQRTGGSVIGFLNGDSEPSLAEIRNSQAHGDPFDGFPWAGLLELVRDLIQYAYRDLIHPTIS